MTLRIRCSGTTRLSSSDRLRHSCKRSRRARPSRAWVVAFAENHSRRPPKSAASSGPPTVRGDSSRNRSLGSPAKGVRRRYLPANGPPSIVNVIVPPSRQIMMSPSAVMSADTAVQRRTGEGAQRPTRPSDCHGGLDSSRRPCRFPLRLKEQRLVRTVTLEEESYGSVSKWLRDQVGIGDWVRDGTVHKYGGAFDHEFANPASRFELGPTTFSDLPTSGSIKVGDCLHGGRRRQGCEEVRARWYFRHVAPVC